MTLTEVKYEQFLGAAEVDHKMQDEEAGVDEKKQQEHNVQQGAVYFSGTQYSKLQSTLRNC
jgi:hypothetical protein